MKYIIIILSLALLAACDDGCPDYKSTFIYKDKVVILSGFYKGQVGYIDQDISFLNTCDKPGYYIIIDNKIVEEYQDNLKKLQ